MNPNSSIKISNLSKQYRLGLVGTGTLSHDLKRWWVMNVLRREDPNLMVGEANVRDKYSDTPYVWALKDIDLEIEQGDVVGIIGKNGAGKSTLLKILSRVTKPTTGTIEYRGRLASLLEVGTGFHSEMTGRENIYMNGSIMGMNRHEITRKLDEIIAFAGVERYIDTPVKRYSSGMTVRLGFSVAAHLEPDILVVDEVLAVGDAEFQKKAIGKMQDVSKGGGRTVLFVSHNMGAVKSLCKNAFVLENGIIQIKGGIDNCVSKYLKGNNTISNHKKAINNPIIEHPDFDLLEIGVKSNGKKFSDIMFIDEELIFLIKLRQKNNKKELDVTLNVKDENGQILFSTGTVFKRTDPIREYSMLEFRGVFYKNFFNWGTFYVDLYIVEDKNRELYSQRDLISFTMVNKEVPFGHYMGKEPGGVLPDFFWEKSKA